MTRHDFELIARTIRTFARSARERARLAEAFADQLEPNHGTFDRRRFYLAACAAPTHGDFERAHDLSKLARNK